MAPGRERGEVRGGGGRRVPTCSHVPGGPLRRGGGGGVCSRPGRLLAAAATRRRLLGRQLSSAASGKCWPPHPHPPDNGATGASRVGCGFGTRSDGPKREKEGTLARAEATAAPDSFSLGGGERKRVGEQSLHCLC